MVSLAKITNMNLAMIIRTCRVLASPALNKLADRDFKIAPHWTARVEIEFCTPSF